LHRKDKSCNGGNGDQPKDKRMVNWKPQNLNRHVAVWTVAMQTPNIRPAMLTSIHGRGCARTKRAQENARLARRVPTAAKASGGQYLL
jgi:hypothetical protein